MSGALAGALAIAAVLCLPVAAVLAFRRSYRRAGRIDRRQPPVPGPPPRPPSGSAASSGEGAVPPCGTPRHRAARDDYRAPGGEDLGACNATIHHHERGVVILDHLRKRRLVVLARPRPGDSDLFARLEREMGQP